MNWHADERALDRYASGMVGDIEAASIEAHVTSCPTCRRLATVTAGAGNAAALDRIKADVDDILDAPPIPRWLRPLRRVGVSDGDLQIVAGAWSLEASWCLATVLAVCFAIVAAELSSTSRSLALFLTIAPVAPLAGIAAAFAPRFDPTTEVAVTCPMPALRVLLVRAIGVLSVTVGVLLLVSAWFGTLSGLAWLLPALALASATLALGTVLRPTIAATGVTIVWLAGALGARSASGTAGEFTSEYVMFRATGQLVCVAIAVVALVSFAARRHTCEVLR